MSCSHRLQKHILALTPALACAQALASALGLALGSGPMIETFRPALGPRPMGPLLYIWVRVHYLSLVEPHLTGELHNEMGSETEKECPHLTYMKSNCFQACLASCKRLNFTSFAGLAHLAEPVWPKARLGRAYGMGPVRTGHIGRRA